MPIKQFSIPSCSSGRDSLIQGSKKKDKFNAAKAAIESARDQATGHFDVDEAIAVSDTIEACSAGLAFYYMSPQLWGCVYMQCVRVCWALTRTFFFSN